MMPETLRIILPEDLPGISVIQVRGRRRLARMFNDSYNLTAGIKGRAEWSYRGIVHERGPGEIGLFEPGEVRVDLKYHSPLDYQVLQIKKSSLDALLDNCGVPRPRRDFHFRTAVAKDTHLISVLQSVSDSIGTGSSWLEKESKLSWFCAILLTRHCEQPAALPKPEAGAAIQKAYEMLIERYSEDVSLDALASVARLSRFHLVAAFRKRYGLPPHAFQLAVRIEKAKAMVVAGMSGTEIAHALGFSDHAHMIRQFKRWQGIPPRSFAKAIHRV